MAPASQNRSSHWETSSAYPSKGSGSSAQSLDSVTSAAKARSRARSQVRRRQAVGEQMRRFQSTVPVALAQGLRLLTPDRRPSQPDVAVVRRSAVRYPSRASQSTGLLAQLGFSGLYWSKLLSLALLAVTVYGLYWFQIDDRWYLEASQIQVSGTVLVNPGELAHSLPVDGWNLFWLRRDELRDLLLQHPWIEDARVSLSAGILAGGSGELRIQVREAPAIGVWATEVGEFLISPHGAALASLSSAPVGLPRLVDPTLDAAVPGTPIGSAIETDIVASALALIGQVSGVTEVRYNDEVGLNFSLPGSPLWVYWGDGSLAQEKLEAIELGRRLLAMGEAGKSILDVRNPGKPTLR